MGVCEQADAGLRIRTNALLRLGASPGFRASAQAAGCVFFLGWDFFSRRVPRASGPEVLPASWLIRTGHADQWDPQVAPLTEQGRVELYTWMLDLEFLFFFFSGQLWLCDPKAAKMCFDPI